MPQVRPPIEQVLPKADAFTAEATIYGDHPTAYIATAMWTSKTIAHPITLSYSSTINASDLTDAFSDGGAWGKGGTPTTNRSGYLLRAPFSNADQKVELAWRARVLAGNGHNPDRFTDVCFVGSRITGGTYSSANHTYTDVATGYFFGFLSASGLEATWYLLRINGGTITVLDSEAFNGATAAGLDAAVTLTLNPKRTNRLSLDVTASGGDVRLVGKLTRPDDSGSSTVTTIFDYTDTSGSKLTAAGRVGFILNGQLTAAGSPGGGIANLVNEFVLTDAGVVVHRDTFERIWRTAGKATTATVSSVVYAGNSLLSAWVGDYSTVVAYDKKLTRCTIAGLTDRLVVAPATEPVGSSTLPGAGAFLLSQRPATDARSQHRTLRVRFSSLKVDGTAGTTNATPHRAAGICIRIAGTGATGTSAPSSSWMPGAGYALIAFREDAAPTTKLQLVRYTDGVATTIADVDPYTFNTNTDYDLTLEAHNALDSAGNPTGAVLLSVYVGGVQVVMVQADSSVTVDAAGTVIDGSSARAIQGRGEGIYAYVPGGDRVVVLDAWAEGTLVDALDADRIEVDQASVTVTAETDGFTGSTLSIPTGAIVQPQRPRRLTSTPMESGHRHVAALDRFARRVWRVTAALDETDRDTLLAFFEAQDGPRLGFWWTPPAPGGGASSTRVAETVAAPVRVHFVGWEIRRQHAAAGGGGVFLFDFELEELRA